MNDFYNASPEEQGQRLEALAEAALPLWGIDANARLVLIKHRENAVFSVSTGDNRHALRVHRAGYHTDDELRSELQWIEAINSDALRTPQVRKTVDGDLFSWVETAAVPEPRQVDMLEWFDGSPIGSVEDGLSDPAEAISLFQTVGQLMATTHNHTQSWQPPAGFTRHAWDEDGLVGETPFWGRYMALDMLEDDQRRTLQEVTAKTRADLAEFGKEADRYGLIHADFQLENLLRSNEGVCLIDFDDSGWGWHLFDIVTPLFFLQGEDGFDDMQAAFIDGYRSARTLTDAHLEQLPMFMLLRGLTYLGWMHTRRETETAQELGPLVVEMVDNLAEAYL